MTIRLVSIKRAGALLSLSALTACTQDVTAPERATNAPAISLLAASNTWADRALMPTPRARLKAASVNGIIYAIGGWGFAPNLNTELIRPKVESYNPATNVWTQKRGLPEPLEPNGATTINGKIYVAGGRGNERTSKALYVYNPATNLWTQRADMPNKGGGGQQGAINGLLYVYLPRTQDSDVMEGPQKFLRYNPVTNTWATLGVPPFARWGGASGVMNGRFYLMGGRRVHNGHEAAAYDVHVYNPASGWSKLPLVPGGLATAGLSYATTGGKLYITGCFGKDVCYPVNKVYNPATNTLTSIATPHFIPSLGAGAAANGLFYEMGGYTCEENLEYGGCIGNAAAGVVEVYTP
jgi:N-acetylneuraminic acid mutarotase